MSMDALKTFLFCNLQLVVSNFLQSPAELTCQWKFLFLLVSFPREINCMLKRTQHDSILHSSHCYILGLYMTNCNTQIVLFLH